MKWFEIEIFEPEVQRILAKDIQDAEHQARLFTEKRKGILKSVELVRDQVVVAMKI